MGHFQRLINPTQLPVLYNFYPSQYLANFAITLWTSAQAIEVQDNSRILRQYSQRHVISFTRYREFV